MQKGTISVCFVTEALVEARRRSVDVASVLERAGIPPELLDKPLARVSRQQYGALWLSLAQELDDEFFGMDSHPMRPGSFHFLCHALLACVTLQQALQWALRFFSLVLDDVRGALDVQDGRARLTLTDRTRAPRLFAHGTLFVILHGLACWLVGRRLPITAAAFCQPAPDHAEEYRLLFGNQVRFDAPCSMLELNASCLTLPVIRDRDSAREFLRQAPANFLVKYRYASGPTMQVRERLCHMPPAEWPDFEVLASAMHTTPSTLRRRLEREGSSYQVIKDELRRDLAIDLLCNSTDGIAVIAYSLGFAEPSAFHRAFRKWTSLSPSEYRHGLAKR